MYRSLWEVPKYRIEMLKMEAVKAVAFHIISEDKDVKTAVLKALATFTTNLKSSGLAIQVSTQFFMCLCMPLFF